MHRGRGRLTVRAALRLDARPIMAPQVVTLAPAQTAGKLSYRAVLADIPAAPRATVTLTM